MKMKKWMFFLIPPAMVLFGWVCGEVVMHLWNWLLPMLFGWRTVTFWQALGLLVLCRILFGGWGGGGNDHSRSKRSKADQWDALTPEERERFRQSVRTRAGCFGGPTGEIKEPA